MERYKCGGLQLGHVHLLNQLDIMPDYDQSVHSPCKNQYDKSLVECWDFNCVTMNSAFPLQEYHNHQI